MESNEELYKKWVDAYSDPSWIWTKIAQHPNDEVTVFYAEYPKDKTYHIVCATKDGKKYAAYSSGAVKFMKTGSRSDLPKEQETLCQKK